MSLFISIAHAQEATAAAEGSVLGGLFPLIAIAIIFYFLLFRPQQKRMKEHQQTISALKKGDTVVTAGGVIGKVTKVDSEKQILDVEIAEGVTIKVKQTTISQTLDKKESPILKTTPAKKTTTKKTTTRKKTTGGTLKKK